jgi:hypothetical protein
VLPNNNYFRKCRAPKEVQALYAIPGAPKDSIGQLRSSAVVTTAFLLLELRIAVNQIRMGTRDSLFSPLAWLQMLEKKWSGREDLNLRPLVPKFEELAKSILINEY